MREVGRACVTAPHGPAFAEAAHPARRSERSRGHAWCSACTAASPQLDALAQVQDLEVGCADGGRGERAAPPQAELTQQRRADTKPAHRLVAQVAQIAMVAERSHGHASAACAAGRSR